MKINKVGLLGMLGAALFCISACSPSVSPPSAGGSGDGGGDTGGGSDPVTPMYPEILTAWILNESNEVAAVMAGDPLVNVQSVTEETINTVDYVTITATGIPNYTLTVTQAHLDFLNARPPSDFLPTPPSGRGHTATLGQLLDFGESINYNSNSNCTNGEGLGYWPPGPECPSNQMKEEKLPTQPVVNTGDDCGLSLNSIGFATNGVSIFSWTDGQSYNSEGSWQTLAALAEAYDVDLCGGHAQQQGNYHHHFYSTCWAESVGDKLTASFVADKDGHSPIYGFAQDGYPVYGPWHADDEPAVSCWKVRDFTNGTGTGGGCSDSARSCHLVDATNPALGTTSTGVSQGPAFNGTYTSLSGNEFDTYAGFFFEDYYYDSSCYTAGTASLDEFNGHEHDDLGYHYHLTIDGPDATTAGPTFPHTFGPNYKGELPAESSASCDGAGGGPGGPPPGP